MMNKSLTRRINSLVCFACRTMDLFARKANGEIEVSFVAEFNGTIDLASNGKEAIKLLKTEKPNDVIVSDLVLSKDSRVDLLNFKVKNGIGGSFIFFCAVKGEIPYSQDEYQQVDKFSFGLLCEEIRRIQ